MKETKSTEFIRTVRERDDYKCAICGAPAEEVVHVMDSKLWDDGGNHAGNGVTLCESHAHSAKTTELSVETIVDAARLPGLMLPEQLHAVQKYDRWGNPILADERRARGELFFDPEARAWLERGRMLERFAPWVKYPRTYVLPWSDSMGEGDRMMPTIDHLRGTRVVATEKMDGENVTLYRDFLHTRSVARIYHPSRDWLNAFWEEVRDGIPEGWRICGEYLYVSHTVTYSNLRSFFLAFSVWNDRNVCLGWDDSLAFLNDVGIDPVPVLYDGPFDRSSIHGAWENQAGQESEGYILRAAEDIPYARFRMSVGKYIREGYAQTEPVRQNVADGSPIHNNSLEATRNPK